MEYHSEKFIDASSLVYKKEKVVAVLPANSLGDSVFSHQGLTYGGLVLNHNCKFQDVLEIFKALCFFYLKEGFKTIVLKPIPGFYNSHFSDEINYLMFIINAKLFRRDILSLLELDNVILSKDRKAGYKRGLKNNLIVKEVNDFSEFWNQILIPNLSKKHGVNPVHSLKEISSLNEKFPLNIRQFNVYKSDRIVAGTTIFETKNAYHSQYISGNADKNLIGSLDYLHFHLFDKLLNREKKFDFGCSNENGGYNINKGLLYWKEGFGARTFTQDFYEFPLENIELLENVFV